MSTSRMGTDFTSQRIIAKLEALAMDLKRISEGSGPTLDELENAPLLDFYAMTERPMYCLKGQVYGHPILGDGQIYTSQIFALNTPQRWARTLTRWYRLGDTRQDIQRKLEGSQSHLF